MNPKDFQQISGVKLPVYVSHFQISQIKASHVRAPNAYFSPTYYYLNQI